MRLGKPPPPRMCRKVKKIAEQVKALPDDDREEFLSWLADFEIEHTDDWDKEISRDSQPGGRLERVLGRVRKDIAEGRTKPLDKLQNEKEAYDEATRFAETQGVVFP